MSKESNPAAISVLIVDDQHLVRAGIKALLDRSDDIEVVGEAADGAAGVRAALQYLPDVVLMDIRMPVLDGVQATRRITADPRLASVAVIVLTTFDADEFVFAAIREGARGFLLKDTEPDDLRRAVRIVAGGESLLSPAVTGRVMQAAALGAPSQVRADLLLPLTHREREVLIEVGAGHTNDEIGRRLQMSAATARTHVSRVMSKLGARDRSQLVVLAYESGLLVPGSPK
ncbi:MAG: response regulator transcription factor [Nakamurella sp.]